MPIELEISFATPAGKVFRAPPGQPLRVVSGTRGTWTLRLTNQAEDLHAGASLQIFSVNIQFAFRFQMDRPGARDYVTYASDGDASFDVLPGGRYDGKPLLLGMRVASGVFRRGESITVTLGDRSGGGAGSEVYWTATAGEVIGAVDAEGNGSLRGFAHGPVAIEAVHHPKPDLIRLLGPTLVAPDEPFRLHAVVFDRNRNLIEDFQGELLLEPCQAAEGLPQTCSFATSLEGVALIEGVRFTRPGVYRIRGRLEDPALSFTSNPIVVESAPAERVFWGDVHCHGWGDSTMLLMARRTKKLDPFERHRQARRVGRYDFAAPGPMSIPADKAGEIWDAWLQAARDHDQPGEYVPFVSFEAHPAEGDRQIIFQSLEAPAPSTYRIPMGDLERRFGQRDDVLLQVHIGGAPPDWFAYRPAREEMVEVVSGFGNAEWLLQWGLSLGYRPAVAGCSDLHLGLLGAPRGVETWRGRFGFMFQMNQRDCGFGSGPVTACLADRCERDLLWSAFKQRRTYATSGARIFLRASANDATLGEEVDGSEGIRLKLRCHGCAPLERIDVLCGDRVIRSWLPGEVDFEHEEQVEAADLCGDWLYLRVRQTDGEYAWSTPFYLTNRPANQERSASLPRWNQEPAVDLGAVGPNEATPFLSAVQTYLETEEDASKFTQVTPMRLVRESMGEAALFFCFFGPDSLPMQIRWFYQFEIPKVRFDWGWQDFGTANELALKKDLRGR